MHEDLRKPLKPRSRLQRMMRRWPTPATAAWIVTLALLAGGVTWGLQTPPPQASGVVTTVEIRQVDPRPVASTGKVVGEEGGKGADVTVPGAPPLKGRKDVPRLKIISVPGDDDDTARVPADPHVPSAENLPRSPEEARRQRFALLGLPADKPLAHAPRRGLTERSPSGPLPKVGRDGRKPWQVYGRPVSKAVLLSDRPKVAIVLGGLGLNIKSTERAIRELPGVITLAFAPHAKNLQSLINRARQAGHEVLLQVPMEPWGYPEVNPGPKTLLAAAGKRETLSALHWFMGRATGYVGLVNYSGQKFLSEGPALSHVLHEVKRRGLLFLDDGSAPKSLSPELSMVIGLPPLAATVRLDTERDPFAIQARLADLEERAARKGSAIGMGSAFPETLEALQNWLTGLRGRIDIVPLSAMPKLKKRN